MLLLLCMSFPTIPYVYDYKIKQICITNENFHAFFCIRNENYVYLQNIEVDFYLPEKHTAIQACYSMGDTNTSEREINALVKLHSFEPLEQALIITRDEESTIKRGNLTIEVKPIWKWLLE